MVESGGFEIRCAGFRYPGFESLSLRRKDIGFDRISGMLKNVQGFETSERGRRPNSRQDVGDSERGGLEKRDTMSSFGRRIPVSPLVNWSGDREAEGVRLESVCTLTGYRGFESLPLRFSPVLIRGSRVRDCRLTPPDLEGSNGKRTIFVHVRLTGSGGFL